MVYKVLLPGPSEDLATRFYDLVEAFIAEEVEQLLPIRDFLPDREPTVQDSSPDGEDPTDEFMAFSAAWGEQLLPTRDSLPDCEPTVEDSSPDAEEDEEDEDAEDDAEEDEAGFLGLAQYYLNVEVY